MKSTNGGRSVSVWLGICLALGITAHAQRTQLVINEERLAHEHFGADAPWFRANIPFLEIDDPEIQKVYYYRWQLYRSHLRELGIQGIGVTEFLPDVPWARHPYTDLNDSSSFHILEGRWLRNLAFVGSLVDHLYAGGGNDRHFSESIAAATLAWTQVTGDTAPALRHLDAMQHIYNLWDDHFDARRNLYWIEPLLDATEYTISSIDASGAGFAEKPGSRDNENGFTGGYAFRPSINAYQFANAEAIATLALAAGKPELANEYTRRAEALRHAVLGQLWNEPLQHFTDVYQRSTATVTAGDFIRGRELVGYVPWMYDLLPHDATAANAPDFSLAWQHALRPTELGGPFGLRTVEPSYPRYMRQYRYDRATGLRECQWNGPSWPFQTSQTLTAMANLLHDYKQQAVTADDYLRLLRQYTREHLTASGEPDLQEDYDPETGKPIVGLPRSHHYNHSTYNNLVLSGLLGIKPRNDDVLEIDPLIPTGGTERPIRYFALQGLRYHGHNLTVVYDVDGKRYHLGAGFTVVSDGKPIYGPAPLRKTLVPLPAAPPSATTKRLPFDLAVNVWDRAPTAYEAELPIASASSTAAGSNAYEAIDGRLWFFPEIANGWSPEKCEAPPAPPDSKAEAGCWFAVDLRRAAYLGFAQLFFFADGREYQAPADYRLQYLEADRWKDIAAQRHSPATPLANGENDISFPSVQTQHIRVLLSAPADAKVRLIEFKVFSVSPSGKQATVSETAVK